MAAIIEFLRPINGPDAGTGALHGFLLLKNDAGQYTMIARGGPEAEDALRNKWGGKGPRSLP